MTTTRTRTLNLSSSVRPVAGRSAGPVRAAGQRGGDGREVERREVAVDRGGAWLLARRRRATRRRAGYAGGCTPAAHSTRYEYARQRRGDVTAQVDGARARAAPRTSAGA